MTRLVASFCVCFLLAILPAVASDVIDFSAVDRQGEEISLSELLEDNKLVLINFWLAGCGPSNELLPYLQAFQDTYETEGLSSVIIYRYFQCTADLGEYYFGANDYTIPIVEDRTGKLQDLFAVRAFPHTIIVDCECKTLLDECGYCRGYEVCIQELIHHELLGQPLHSNQVIDLSE